MERLLEAERRNLGHYGFGIKGFVLSMIETAIEVTEDRVPATCHPPRSSRPGRRCWPSDRALPHAREAVEAVAADAPRAADHQGRPAGPGAQAGAIGAGRPVRRGRDRVGQDAAVYAEIFARQATGPERAMMVGNSMKSDVVPVIEAGGWGVFVPHDLTGRWNRPRRPRRFRETPDLGGGLPGWFFKTSPDSPQRRHKLRLQ
jgi:putative hydrolase of the HAD superfamily